MLGDWYADVLMMELEPKACGPKPVVDMHIWIVALLMRSKASRHASAGGHFSIRSPSTDVAARTVKSTSSNDFDTLTISFTIGKTILPDDFGLPGSARLHRGRISLCSVSYPLMKYIAHHCLPAMNK